MNFFKQNKEQYERKRKKGESHSYKFYLDVALNIQVLVYRFIYDISNVLFQIKYL